MPAALLPTQPRRGVALFGKGWKRHETEVPCAGAKRSVTAAADGWNIKALFRQPRRLLRRPAVCHTAAVEQPSEAAAAAEADHASAARLQHAVSIAPLSAAQQAQQDSLESMLQGERLWQRAGSRTWQGGAPARSGSRVARAGGSTAGRCPPPDALEMAMGERVPSSRSCRIADTSARLAAAQREVQHLQGQLSKCEAQLAAVLQQAEHAEAAADGLPTAELENQAHELEHELKEMDSHFEAEVHRLAAIARATRRRTAALQAAAKEQAALAGGWQRRVQLMQDTHQPLSRLEEEKRQHLEAQFRFRVIRFSSDA